MRRKKNNAALWFAVILCAIALIGVVQGKKSKVSQPAGPALESEAKSSVSAPKGALKVHFLDVGQGDSEYLELPGGKTMLIDAGNPENGMDIVSAIKKSGHDRVDYLIATHPHSDHIGGMEKVIQSLQIGTFYMPRTSESDTPTTEVYKNLLQAVKEKGLKVYTAKAGVTVYSGNNGSAAFVAPNGTGYGDLNQYSGVLLLTYGKNRFLFTGDAGTVSEKQITADVKADVLKVGHHGSSTATGAEFLKRVSPKYAVIEVGRDNSYGLPAQSTLTKLKKIGAAIYRTDRLGTITFTSNGNGISVDKEPSG